MQNHYNGRYIKRDTIDLWTETFGKSEDPAILLISGAMAPARFWTDEFCNYLASQDFFVIRFDHRDTGLSSPIDYAKNPYDLDDVVEDVIAILDAYNLHNAHLIGHSMGAMIAQFCALKYPERCKSITVISGRSLKEPSLSEAEQELLKKTWEILLTNKPTLNYEESVEGFLRSYTYLNGTIDFDEKMAKAYIKDMYERSKHIYLTEDGQVKAFEVPHNHVKTQEDIDSKEYDLRKITVPTLIIHGEQDYIMVPANAKAIASEMPGAKLTIIPKMGHMFFNQELEKHIADHILDHIRQKNK